LRQCRLGVGQYGYRYDAIDPSPDSRGRRCRPCCARLAADAASDAGVQGFAPEACLINRYVPGAKLSLHQDKDELDFAAPIVSVSLGLPAIFLFGGAKRADKPNRYRLEHGDVVVWGGRRGCSFTASPRSPTANMR
jgi:alkylated DNA repair protein (DNA oxidative demethylase)